MQRVIEALRQKERPFYLTGASALDLFFKNEFPPDITAAVEGSLIDVAKMFPDVDYPGSPEADAVVPVEDRRLILRCVDSVGELEREPIPQMNFLYDIGGRKFLDRFGVYHLLREQSLDQALDRVSGTGALNWDLQIQTAILVSRFHYTYPLGIRFPDPPKEVLPPPSQRYLLSSILTGRFPDEGLAFLKECGFIHVHWPELEGLDAVDHSKEYHPEGNGWQHTLATFTYRKTTSLPLSLALLLHDIGKSEADRVEGRQFHRHAQLGSYTASRFVRRLGYSEELAERIRFLVQNHMLPSFLDKIPPARIREALASPYFPELLELFRCDVASSYRGLDAYYRACKVYKKYTKNKKNPFREIDGRISRIHSPI